MTTIKDVAKEANVSIATVSRVINNSGYVNSHTKELVEKAIAKLNYVPNELARSFYTKSSKIIGVIIPHLNTQFFSTLVQGIEKTAMENGYKVMLCNTQDNPEREIAYLHILEQYCIEGIILASNPTNIEKFETLKIPVVTVDHILNENIPSVLSDNIKGGELAAKKFVENGRKNLVQFRGPDFLETISERSCGFDNYLKQFNIEANFIDMDVLEPDHQMMEDYILNHKVDGIFAATDLVALHALQVLNKLNIKVPDDVELIGFDNIKFTDLVTPRITTVEQNISKMGKEAMNVIINLVAGNDIEQKHKILPVKLIEKDTTK